METQVVRPTGRATTIYLQGMVYPSIGDSTPLLFQLPGSTDCFIPVFRSQSALRTFMRTYSMEYDEICRIDDADGFYNYLPKRLDGAALKILANPEQMADGQLRFFVVCGN